MKQVQNVFWGIKTKHNNVVEIFEEGVRWGRGQLQKGERDPGQGRPQTKAGGLKQPKGSGQPGGKVHRGNQAGRLESTDWKYVLPSEGICPSFYSHNHKGVIRAAE